MKFHFHEKYLSLTIISTGSIAIDNLGNFSIIPHDAMKMNQERLTGKNITIGQRVINNGTPTSVAPVVTHM